MASSEPSSPALILKIQQLLPMLTKSEKAVANYIIQHPEAIINLSLLELAENCSVSEASVVRACQKLGFSGYQNMKVSLAQSVVTPLAANSEEVTVDDDPAQVINKVFSSTAHSLQFSRDIFHPEDLLTAVSLLESARRIEIYGLGGSGPIAMDLQHKLMRLGLNATAYTDPHLQAISAAHCTPDDLVFAISHSGSSKNVVSNTKTAKWNGAKVITLTNLGHSPLNKLGDVQLFTASEETKYRIVALSSRIAELTILDSIYTYMAVRSESIRSMCVEKAMDDLKY